MIRVSSQFQVNRGVIASDHHYAAIVPRLRSGRQPFETCGTWRGTYRTRYRIGSSGTYREGWSNRRRDRLPISKATQVAKRKKEESLTQRAFTSLDNQLIWETVSTTMSAWIQTHWELEDKVHTSLSWPDRNATRCTRKRFCARFQSTFTGSCPGKSRTLRFKRNPASPESTKAGNSAPYDYPCASITRAESASNTRRVGVQSTHPRLHTILLHKSLGVEAIPRPVSVQLRPELSPHARIRQ